MIRALAKGEKKQTNLKANYMPFCQLNVKFELNDFQA